MATKTVKPRNQRGYYEVDGQQLPSVTTILGVIDKPALIQWAANTAIDATFELLTMPGAPEDMESIKVRAKSEWRRLGKQAMDYGTRVHELADRHLAGMPEDISGEPEPVLRGMGAFCDWLYHSGFVQVAGEQQVYSIKHGYAGTLDQRGLIGNKPVIIDFKTAGKVPESPYPEVKLQLVAYARAYEEMSGERVPTAVVIYLGRETGEFAAFDVNNEDATFNAFLAAKELWAWKNGR